MPLVSLRKHLRLALTIMLGILVLGVAAVWTKGKYVYSVTATVYVAQHFASILKDSKELEFAGSQAYKQFIEQQVLTIGRYDILLEALARMGERRFVWQLPGESDRRAAERLQAALVIKSVKDTYLITVSLESENPDGLDVVINTVLETYLEKTRQLDSFFARDERMGALRERRQKIVASMGETMKRRTQIGEQLGVTTFTANATNPYDQLLMDSQIALAKAQRDRITSESNLAIFEGKNGQDAIAAIAFDSVQKDAGLNSLKANLHERRSVLFQQISGLEDKHPLTSQIKQELEHIDEELNRISNEVLQAVENSLLEQRRGDVRRDRQIESELDKQIAGLRQKASGFATLYNEGVVLNEKMVRDRSQLDALDSRIEYFEMESQAPGFIRIDSYARPPEIPVKGGRKKLFMMVLAAAIGLGLGVPIGLDMLDRRIKTPGQVAKLLGHAPLAAILEISENVAVRRVRDDQLRRLAITLDRERQTHGNPIVLMTSVKPGGGVTSLAFELGHELHEMGVRSLVVETNPFKPDSRYTAKPMTPGLLDLLVEPIDVADAVIPGSEALPDRMGVGFALDPHLFAYTKLRQRLDELKARYDVILLDAPPILLSGDTEYLASIADVSLLLIGSGQISPGELRRAADIMQKVNPPVIGFIVTHLKIYKGGGYFAKQVEEYAAAEAIAQEAVRAHPLKNTPT
jgi:polysaccharide biosynthesis transport protein